MPLFKRAFDLAVQDDGWAFLGALGHHLRQLDPGFDPRTYGYKQLSLLVKGSSRNLRGQAACGGRGIDHIYVKLKEDENS